MITCGSCQHLNPDGSRFCEGCGQALSPDRARPPAAADPPTALSAPRAPDPAAPTRQANRCPACRATVAADDTFCSACGKPVGRARTPTTSLPGPGAAPVAAGPAPGGRRCGNCGSDNLPEYTFCEKCGAGLRGATGSPPVASPRSKTAAGAAAPDRQSGAAGVGAAPVTPSRESAIAPRLVTANGLAFTLAGRSEAIVGRTDPASGAYPDVDLGPYGGEDGGVSRRHARLSFRGGRWAIEDLNSVNFTYVNGLKLQPAAPRVLQDGDQIRLGRVVITFSAR